MSSRPADVTAAGAVLWRPSDKHGFTVAVIHRPRYDDWSLPKGKAEPGEVPAVTAVREVAEETGFTARLGRSLGEVAYRAAAGRKVVHYFAASVVDGEFAVNKEVDALKWLPVHKARALLSYRRDRSLVVEFAALPAQLTTVLLVRHASAGRRGAFAGDDSRRPLDSGGRKQAAALTDRLAAFGPTRIGAAPLVRCRETIAPLAQALGRDIRDEAALSEVAYAADPAAAQRRLVELAARRKTTAVCSQGGVIPALVGEFAARGGLVLPTHATPKAAYWVLSFDGHHLRQADRYDAND